MEPMTDIGKIPITACPLCGAVNLSVVHGIRVHGGTDPDLIACSNCGASFSLSADGEHVRFNRIPSPYAYFSEVYAQWVLLTTAMRLGDAIRSNPVEALEFLTSAKQLSWNLRTILGSQAEATAEGIKLGYLWRMPPKSKDEARRELDRIRKMERDINAFLVNTREQMVGIREAYSGDNEDPTARNSALEPYQRAMEDAVRILDELDKAKQAIQAWLENRP